MTTDDVKQALQHGIDAYLRSISGETLDLTIAESIWLAAPEASFIHAGMSTVGIRSSPTSTKGLWPTS